MFHRNPLRGFGAPGGRNLPIPITLAIGFYNSLHYRASRDLLLLVAVFAVRAVYTGDLYALPVHTARTYSPYVRAVCVEV